MELSHANLRVVTYEYTICDNLKNLACNIMFISQSFFYNLFALRFLYFIQVSAKL